MAEHNPLHSSLCQVDLLQRVLLILMSYHIKQWEDTVAPRHNGCEGVTNSYDTHRIKLQKISYEEVFTFGGDLEHAGGWNRSFTPKYCLSSFQCFSCFPWHSLTGRKKKGAFNVKYTWTNIRVRQIIFSRFAFSCTNVEITPIIFTPICEKKYENNFIVSMFYD